MEWRTHDICGTLTGQYAPSDNLGGKLDLTKNIHVSGTGCPRKKTIEWGGEKILVGIVLRIQFVSNFNDQGMSIRCIGKLRHQSDFHSPYSRLSDPGF